MLCLGIETATLSPGIGLADENGVLLERSGENPPSKAQAIFVYLNNLISQEKIDLKGIDLISVTAGPGSFTGLKVGLAAAKGLALGLGIPCVGVSSLMALARNRAGQGGGPVGALFDARRGLIYAALFEFGADSDPIRLSRDRALTPEEWAVEIADLDPDRPVTLVGQGLATYGDYLKEHLGAGVVLAPQEDWDISPGTVARMGIEAAQAGQSVPPEELSAEYLRPVDAVLPKKALTRLD